MQLSEILGLLLFFCGGYTNLEVASGLGEACMFVSSFGLALLHVLTHFLAATSRGADQNRLLRVVPELRASAPVCRRVRFLLVAPC